MNRFLKLKKRPNGALVFIGLILFCTLLGITCVSINSDQRQNIITNSNYIIISKTEDIWNATWGGDSSDHGAGVALDSNKSIYCIGTDYSHGAYGEYELIKYFPNGTMTWNISWGDEYQQEGKGIVISNDFIYCVGISGSNYPPQYG